MVQSMSSSATAKQVEAGTGAAAMRAQDYAAVNDWPGYFKAVLGKPARETLVKALDLFEAEKLPQGERVAVDLACGEGRDTLELLARGWRVTAIDSHPDGLRLLQERVKPEHAPGLVATVGTFREARWARCRLFNCSYALPFCAAADFPGLWDRIVSSIEPGGRFAGQLFGERDAWAASGHTLGHTRAQVNELFGGFVLESFQEEEKDDKDAQGNPKHWHVYHIVARKRV